MAEAPSPYAPGIIADERAPARAAGRPVVFLVAAFAMAVALMGGLWHLPIRGATDGLDPAYETIARVIFVGNAVSSLALLWAYLTDVVPVFGARREGTLLLTGIIAVIAWGALGFAGDNRFVWYGTAALFGLVTGATRAVVLGALAEIGQRRLRTATLAAAYFGVLQLGELAARALKTPLLFMPRAWTTGLGAGLALSVVVLVVATLGEDRLPPPEATALPRVTIPRFLRSRAFWASFGLQLCSGLLTLPWESFVRTVRFASGTDDRVFQLHWMSPAMWLTAVPVYLIASRYVPFRILLRLVLLAKAIALLASYAEPTHTVQMLCAAGRGMAAIACMDLAMRVAPPGREAFGVILLVGVSTVASAAVAPLAATLGDGRGMVALAGLGVAVLATLLVSLLPRDVH